MSSSDQRANGHKAAPGTATDAILKPSGPVAAGMRRVEGIDFDEHAGKELTVSGLLEGMKNMGFQASAVAEAARIINEMVRS